MTTEEDSTLFSHIIAVSNRKLTRRPFPEQIRYICQYHPKALILREKDLTEQEYMHLASKIVPICEETGTTCILHFFPNTARSLNVRNIHLPLWKLKQLSASERNWFSEIGTSVHSVRDAADAHQYGATYMSAGHIYETKCKEGLPPRGLPFLREICAMSRIPVFGIGGIRLDPVQIKEVESCGAAGVCIMSGLMQMS